MKDDQGFGGLLNSGVCLWREVVLGYLLARNRWMMIKVLCCFVLLLFFPSDMDESFINRFPQAGHTTRPGLHATNAFGM